LKKIDKKLFIYIYLSNNITFLADIYIIGYRLKRG